jgi:hypothetical protein
MWPDLVAAEAGCAAGPRPWGGLVRGRRQGSRWPPDQRDSVVFGVSSLHLREPCSALTGIRRVIRRQPGAGGPVSRRATGSHSASARCSSRLDVAMRARFTADKGRPGSAARQGKARFARCRLKASAGASRPVRAPRRSAAGPSRLALNGQPGAGEGNALPNRPFTGRSGRILRCARRPRMPATRRG